MRRALRSIAPAPVTRAGPLVALLAAGTARRFGGGKLDAMLCGRSVGDRALDTAAALGADIAIVVPDAPPLFASVAADQGRARLIVNPDANDGIGRSVSCAATVAMEGGYPELLILLADMPCLSATRLAAMIGVSPASVAHFARHPDGRAGIPALIPARLLPQLTQLTGDRGARSVLGGEDIALVDWPDDELIDIDTPEALERARQVFDR